MSADQINGNGGRALKTAEFQGYLRGKLEGICEDIVEVKEHFNKIDERLESLDKRITNNRIKVAGIGASVSMIVTLLLIILKDILFK